MLACARLGAVHSVVFGGFAPTELAARIDDARPKVIVAASCGIEPARIVEYKPIIDEALEITAHQPDAVVVLQREQATGDTRRPRRRLGRRAIANAEPADPVPVAATDPLYILYTSGTTGKPKGVVRDNGGHAVALAWSMPNVYDIGPGDVWWTASDVGWVVGHSYIVYAPLLVGATTVLYEGKPVGTPDAGAFWRVDRRARREGAVHRADRVPRDQEGRSRRRPSWPSTTCRGSARCSWPASGSTRRPTTGRTSKLGVPVVDHWWQTETGWPICANLRGLEPMPIKPGSPTVPVPGLRRADPRRHRRGAAAAAEEGAIAIRLPLPPGTLPTLWGDDERYIDVVPDASTTATT